MRLKTIITLILFSFAPFFYGQDLLAMFKDKSSWGFINIKGEVVVEPKYTFCRDFRSGMAKVGKTVFIDIKGEKLKSEVRFVDANEFSDDLLAIKISTTANWGFINKTGKLVIEARYTSVTDFDNGYALAMNKTGTYVLDKTGNETKINYKESEINGIKHFSEGLAIVQIGERFGFINEKGEVVIEPKYLTVGYFSEGLAWVRGDDSKIGFVNSKGEIIIPLIYYSASEFGGEIARIRTKKGWGYINKQGEMLPIDKSIDVFKRPTESTVLVRSNHFWGFLNDKGGWLINAKYKTATPFMNGYSQVEKNGKWGVINKNGDWVLEPTFKHINAFHNVD